jgi:hypothetical protein
MADTPAHSPNEPEEDLDDWDDFLEEPHEVPHQLAAALEELEGLGYVVEAGFGCCTSCMHGALANEEKYVFYHSQDVPDLEKTGEVYLGWCGDAQEIVAVLERHGLNPVWNGREDTRILVKLAMAEPAAGA